MCGPAFDRIGGAHSQITKTDKRDGPLSGLGVSLLDPAGLGPAMFDKPDVPKPKPPPPPEDETKILFREMARAQTEERLRMRKPSGGSR